MEQIQGCVERITFQNPENGYTIAHLAIPRRSDTVCIVGNMPSIQVGETIRCQGHWKQHLIHGLQFVVVESHLQAPADLHGIKKYLGSGLIKGIGPGYAGRIVELFGLETLDIIDQSPERLLEIPRLGKKRIETIKECWAQQKSIRDVMVFLQSHGMSPAYAQKIYKYYGNSSIKKVTENPYILAQEITGIGFKTADAIAEKLGIHHHSPHRIDAGVEYVLIQLSNEGHVCFPVKEFLVEAAQILTVELASIQERLLDLKNAGRIELFDLVHGGELTPFIWIKGLFLAEVGIAREIQRLYHSPCHLRSVDTSKAIEWVQNQLKIVLAENQKVAVIASLSEKVHLITGGPGTGKSTITNAIICITEKLTQKICLAAPTGRAAKRLSEITGKKALTIHSLLAYDFKAGGFKYHRNNPLDCDLIIIDEASMIDTSLMYSLLKAIPNHARVIFVGDVDQLPSVGPGNVLRDMISSLCLPVTILNEIYRQAAGSRIITNAHRINKGIFPDIRNLSESDFFFVESETPEDVLKNVILMTTQRLPQKYGFNSIDDIQVLAPMRKGMIGTENLNFSLQQALNPPKDPFFIGGRKFSVGDKVMQIKNNYQKEVYNGDLGRILAIDPIDHQLTIKFDEREVFYDFIDLDEIALAYAVSIHKFQGSDSPGIVIVVHTSHFKLLYRNLLYTGITRGKRIVVLVGTKQALGIAVKNDEVKKRHTGLRQAIIGTF